jgi:CheY-like chemotaxis protein
MVFMTGGAFTPRAEEFLNAGERPVIAKPFESDELLAKLGEILVAR